jgi:uncharacterized OB-fold protein
MTSPARYLPSDWRLPVLTPENHAFFTSGELVVQQCRRCGLVQHPPIEICHHCQSFEFDYVTAEPVGDVVSVTVVHHATHPILAEAVPYNVVVVALRDHPGVHIVGNVVGAEPNAIKVGTTVRAQWAAVAGLDAAETIIRLPQWEAVP